MPHIEELDPELVLKLIEGYEDGVGPAIKERDDHYSSLRCPRCGGECRKIGGGMHALLDRSTPRFNLECLACGCEFEPQSGMIVRLGNPGAAMEPSVPLIGSKPRSG